MTQNNPTIFASTIGLIGDWANDRNLVKGSTPKAQFFKFVSETGEWAEAIVTGDRREIIDGIGDAMVVLTIIALQLGADILELYDNTPATKYASTDLMLFSVQGKLADALAKGQDDKAKALIGEMVLSLVRTSYRCATDINTALLMAYNDIKDRKGIMFEGVFIKESDPRYEELVKASL